MSVVHDSVNIPAGGLSVGRFAASTGAAAALVAAQRAAIVSRGGRPDLAGEYLGAVHHLQPRAPRTAR